MNFVEIDTVTAHKSAGIVYSRDNAGGGPQGCCRCKFFMVLGVEYDAESTSRQGKRSAQENHPQSDNEADQWRSCGRRKWRVDASGNRLAESSERLEDFRSRYRNDRSGSHSQPGGADSHSRLRTVPGTWRT